MVFNQNGLFNRADNTVGKHDQAKAREELEMLLGEVQMAKYEEVLSDENYENKLDNKIQEVGELLDKDTSNPNCQQVVVEGYIFLIDRSVPKIIDYIGPANGVVITASVSSSNGWVKAGEGKVTIVGTIKTYSGGTITNSTATSNGNKITSFPTTGGNYKIEVTENTTIVITAVDSNNKDNKKSIPITMKVDNIPPTVDNLIVTEDDLKITISATGTDNESGLNHFSYIISSEEDTTLSGIPQDKRTGTFFSGETVEILATNDPLYTITVAAIDNVGNKTPEVGLKTAKVFEGITLSEAKEKVNKDTLQQYIGIKVRDYNPPAGGIYRVFYYDAAGDFGPQNMLYLKRDYTNETISILENYDNYSASAEGIQMTERMNPKWKNYPTTGANIINLANEKSISWLCDPKNWADYKTKNSSFAIGSPSVEMFMKAYNVWKQNNPDGNALICKVDSEDGYAVGANGVYENSGNSTNAGAVEPGRKNIFAEKGPCWLCSPAHSWGNFQCAINVESYGVGYGIGYRLRGNAFGICPIVPIDM